MAKVYTAAPVVFAPRHLLLVMAVGFAVIVVHGAMAPWASLSGYGPELIVILVVYAALRGEEAWMALLAAFALGFLRDAVGGSFLGFNQFTFVLLAWLFHPFRTRLNFFSVPILMALVFFLWLGGQLFIMTPVMAVLGWPSYTFNPLPAFFVSAAATAFLAPPLFFVLDRLTGNTPEARNEA